MYRPVHRDIWNFHKSWGQTGLEFNGSVNILWLDAMHDNSGENGVLKVMENINPEVIETIGYNELETSYLQYFKILKSQVPYVKASLPISGITNDEKELSAKFAQYRKTYIREYPFHS